MKFSTLIVSLLLSQQIFANVVELSGPHKEAVREALIDSLNRSRLSCEIEGGPYPGNNMMGAVLIYILRNDSARFYADETEIRPKITVKRPSNFRDLNYIEMNFNTSFDQEKVEFVEVYEARTRLERQNVGTIFNPRFEMVEVHDQVLAGRCDLY